MSEQGQTPDREDAEREDSERWSLVEQACSDDLPKRRAALERLLVQNVPSLRFYLTHQLRLDPALVDDLLQQFVLDKVLTNQMLAAADRRRGRFRGLLRMALRNFVLDRWRRTQADKRAPDRAGRLTDEMAAALTDDSPERANLSDVAYAWQVLLTTLRRLRAECLAESRGDLWDVFEQRVLRPAAVGGEPAELGALARRLGYTSKSEVSNALVTVQRKLNRTLRRELARYVPAGEVEAELADLHRILLASDAWQPALAELGDWQPESLEMSTDLPSYNAAQFRELLRFGDTNDPQFGADVLAASLRAILDVPLSQLWDDECGNECAGERDDAHRTDMGRPAGSVTATVGSLLAARRPAKTDLVKLKEFFKREAMRPERALPQAVCTLGYYAAIVVAGIRLQEPISTLGSDALLHGIGWLNQQTWLDPATRQLFAHGRKWLGSLEDSG